jgi:hypothetical protein
VKANDKNLRLVVDDKKERNTMTRVASRYDNLNSLSRVLYDEIRDGFVCAFCLDDFTISQLHATYGGNILPTFVTLTNKTARALEKEPCLICDLPCSRFLDD